MVTAIILINVERDKVNSVAEKLVEFEGVSEVFSVTGRYDLIALVRVQNNDGLADLVTRQLLQVQGITASETLFAFRVFSRHDLESMFAIGLGEEE